MNTESPNPYEAPATDPQRAIIGALDDALQTRDHVEFAGEITRRDLVAAVRGSAMRRDLRSLRRSRLLLLVPAALVVFLVALVRVRGGSLENVTILISGLVIIVLYASMTHRWLVNRHVKNNSDLIGITKGRIDRESLWIENENQIRYRPMSGLVGSDSNRRGWVLCFDSTHSLFEVLPLGGFDDPDTAQILAANLAEARPFSAIVPFDSRSLESPSGQSCFVPGDDAVFYEGELRMEDIEGTPLAKSQRRTRISALVRMLVTVALILMFIWAITYSWVVTLAAFAVMTFFVIRVMIRIFKDPLAGQADAGVLWRSAGWIDGSGIVSMTSVGQTSSKWPAFDRAAITDRAITLRTQSGALWHITGRRQFPDDSQWQAACEKVRDRLPSE